MNTTEMTERQGLIRCKPNHRPNSKTSNRKYGDGEHKNSSPRYVAARVESAIRADVGTALSVGLIEATTDFIAVHYTSLDAVIAML